MTNPWSRKVRVEVDGAIYQGRHSVHQSGERVWIDGGEVGVDVDCDGDPIRRPSAPALLLHPYRASPGGCTTPEAQPLLADTRRAGRRVVVTCAIVAALVGGLLAMLGAVWPLVVAAQLLAGLAAFRLCIWGLRRGEEGSR